MVLFFFPRIAKMMELRRTEEKLTGDIADLKEKIRVLEKEEYLIRNDVTHLERVMREELRLVKPGEIVYKLVPEQPKPTEQDAARAKQAAE